MDGLDNLENNVVRAIEVIHSLIQKNDELHKEIDILKGKNSESELIIKQLQEENQGINISPENVHFTKEKENKIRMIIQQILDKLDSFDKLSNNI